MRFSKMFVIFLILFVTSGCSSGEPEDNSDNQNETADDFNVLPDSNVPDENIADDEKVDTDPEDPWYNQDDDDDGLPNGVECPSKPCRDTDGDGTDDYLDTDSDDDGIPDSVETPNGVLVDTDEDGTPDYIDTDSDGDGIPDSVEGTQDFDGDGTPNYRDLDSDDDGIFDQIECFEQPCVDSDGDSMPDYLDTDSDDDGIPDLYEGVDDPDKDGLPNFIDKDSDGDGIEDYVENGETIPPLDSDKDGTYDFLDLDSDNDGLSDAQELEFGSDPKLKDTDGDTFDDFTEFIFGSNPKDPDSGIPENAFYIILPYESDPVIKNLDFSTDIKKVDVLILVDLSGSMLEEHTNLKNGIKTTIIDGVKAEIPDSAFGLVKFGTLNYQAFNMTATMTTDADLVKNAVDGISSADGWAEYHEFAMYASLVGDAITEQIKYCYNDGLFSDDYKTDNISQPAVSCPAGTYGRACFRNESLPIMIMASDENFYHLDDKGKKWEWQSGFEKTKDIVIAEMNKVNAKFIGINTVGDSRDPQADYDYMAAGTGSVNALGQNFNQKFSSDGTGFSQKIVDAVVELTNNIQIDITTKAKHIDNVYGVTDTTKFIKSLSPDSFPDVKPGQTVTFDVTFENTIYENETYESKVFSAVINVLGDGSFLDSREVFIVVPGKDYTGPGN